MGQIKWPGWLDLAHRPYFTCPWFRDWSAQCQPLQHGYPLYYPICPRASVRTAFMALLMAPIDSCRGLTWATSKGAIQGQQEGRWKVRQIIFGGWWWSCFEHRIGLDSLRRFLPILLFYDHHLDTNLNKYILWLLGQGHLLCSVTLAYETFRAGISGLWSPSFFSSLSMWSVLNWLNAGGMQWKTRWKFKESE